MVRVRSIEIGETGRLFAFARTLGRDDPAWVAPLEVVERARIASFHRKGRIRLFVAERDREVVGTISALSDDGYRAHKGEDVAWFGYLHCEDDPATSQRLFDAVLDQARVWGCDRLRGPRNLTRWDGMGLTVAGHHTLPPFMQLHHRASLQALVEGLGFAKHHDVLAYETPVVDASGRRRELPEPLFSKARDCAIDGLEIRAARRRRMTDDLRGAHKVLNQAFATVPDISPMAESQFLALGRVFLTIANPQLLQLARVNGEAVGFAATFPEFNEALVAMRGRILPLGWWRTALALRRVRTASFKFLGVEPRYRGTGLHAKLIDHVIEGVRRAGYTRLEASAIDERNGPMRAVVERAGLTVYRRWRLYERAVG